MENRNKLGQFKKGHKFWLGKKRPTISREKNYNWKGGKIIQNGYVCILCPSHPRAKSKKGYVYEHIWVMEKHLRRYLKMGKSEECVHHMDGNRLNNNLKNLRLFKTNAEHRLFHAKLRKQKNARNKKR